MSSSLIKCIPLSLQFLPLLKRFSGHPEKLLSLLEFAAWIRFPLVEMDAHEVMNGCSTLLKPFGEDESVKVKVLSVLTWLSPFATKKNVLQAFNLNVNCIALIEEKDQVKWIQKLPKLMEKASAEDQTKIYETIIEKTKLLLEDSRSLASLELLKLSFTIANQKTFAPSTQLLILYCKKQYDGDVWGCINFLILHHPILKKDLKNGEFKEFLLDLVNQALNEPEPSLESIVTLIKEYQIAPSAFIWKKLLELPATKSPLFPTILSIWKKSSLQLEPSREKDNCWCTIIDVILTESNPLNQCDLLQKLASKEISFSDPEMTLVVIEKVLNYFLPTLRKFSFDEKISDAKKFTFESMQDFVSLRKELQHSNQTGRFDKILLTTLKKILDELFILEIYEEALSYSETYLINIENEENISDLEEVFCLTLELIQTFNEENKKMFSDRVLKLINCVLKNNAPFDFSKIFRSLVINEDPFFNSISLDVLLKFLDTSDLQLCEEYQTKTHNFLFDILKRENESIPFEQLEKIHTIFDHKDRLAVVSRESLRELRILFLKHCIEKLKSPELTSFSWIESQINYVPESNTRREIVKSLFAKLYRESPNLDFFKTAINQCFKFLTGEKKPKRSLLIARINFLDTTKYCLHATFCNEREKYFDFLLEVFKDFLEGGKEIKVNTIYEIIFQFCSNFIEDRDELSYAQTAFRIAQESGIFEQFEWGTHYHHACFLVSCNEEEMVKEKMLPLSGDSSASFDKDDYMAMCLLAIQSLIQNDTSTFSTKQRLLKILNFAHSFLDCHYLKAAYMNYQMKIYQWFTNAILHKEHMDQCFAKATLPTKNRGFDPSNYSLECYDFVSAWGETLLLQIGSLKDLMEAETIETFINEHSNPKYKALIQFDSEIYARQVGSVNNPLKILVPTILVNELLSFIIRIAPKIEKEREVKQFVISFLKKSVKRGAFKFKKEFFFRLLNQHVFPYLASRHDSLDIEGDPSLLLLSPTLSWSDRKDKKVCGWQVDSIQKWMEFLLEKPNEGRKKYCLSLLRRMEEEQFFKMHKEHFKKMVSNVQKTRLSQK